MRRAVQQLTPGPLFMYRVVDPHARPSRPLDVLQALRAQTELIFPAVHHHISVSSAPRTAPRSSQGSVCVCLPACVACRCTRIAAVGNQSLQEYPCCDQPAPPGVFQGGAACLRHYTAPGVPKVECVRAFLFRASAPRSVPR